MNNFVQAFRKVFFGKKWRNKIEIQHKMLNDFCFLHFDSKKNKHYPSIGSCVLNLKNEITSIFHLKKFPHLKCIYYYWYYIWVRSTTISIWHFSPLPHPQCSCMKMHSKITVFCNQNSIHTIGLHPLISFWHVTGIDDQSKWIYTTLSATTTKKY